MGLVVVGGGGRAEAEVIAFGIRSDGDATGGGAGWSQCCCCLLIYLPLFWSVVQSKRKREFEI